MTEQGKPYQGPRRREIPRPTNIGQELVEAREQGVGWKALMTRYGLGRTRLWMLWSDAKKSVHEHLSGSNKTDIAA